MALLRGHDAVVVGAGPNGLAAAIVLARAGLSVALVEQGETVGGGTRTEELIVPGFRHDICSAVHPLTVASPFMQTLPLREFGLEWLFPDVQLAHPLPDGTAALMYRDVDETADGLGIDAGRYRRLFRLLVRNWPFLADDLLAPLHFPRHPLKFVLFGAAGLLPASFFGALAFRGSPPRALFAGMAAHSFLPLGRPLSAAFGLILGTLGHAAGWPVAKGGSQAIADAMASYFRSLGGTIITGERVSSLAEIQARIVMLDVTPRQLLSLAGERLPSGYRKRLEAYRYGPGIFKVDWALNGPIPWAAAGCRKAATVHVGGTAEEIARSEREVWQGVNPERPFVLVVQPTVVDPSRAPGGKHVGWAYCHVPNGSTVDMTDRIEGQVERFAPGFRRLVIGRHTRDCAGFERYNPNYVGGDINGGIQDLRQFLARPTLFAPYSTPIPGVYLCSSGTPPGGGVHGMCGYHAGRLALKDLGRGG